MKKETTADIEVDFRPRRSTTGSAAVDSESRKRKNKTLQQTTNPKAVGEENRKTYHFEASGSHKINSTHTMGVESRYQKQIAVTEKDGSMETIRTRGGSFSEEKEQAPKFAMSKKRHKGSSGTHASSTDDIEESEEREGTDVFGSEDESEESMLRAFSGEEGKKISQAMTLAKQLTSKIDKKYLLKIKKKEQLKDHLMMCAALRKLFVEGNCTEKAPINPIKKELWKKWRELSELSDAEKEKLKPKIFEHTEAAIDIFFKDPDFSSLVAKYNQDFSQIKELCTDYKALVASKSPSKPTVSDGPKVSTSGKPDPADVDAFMLQFGQAQMQVTKAYLRLMESVRTRWNNSESDTLSREETARKTRDDLLSIQDQLIKYQNSIIVYQSDVNALWQIMIDHQQLMNNDFTWDMVNSINSDDGKDIPSAAMKPKKSGSKRFLRFFSKKLSSGSKNKKR